MANNDQLVPTTLQVIVSTANIQKLNRNNFLPWKRQVEIILKLRNLQAAIAEDGTPDERTDMAAVLVLLGTTDEEHRIQVQAEPSAKHMLRYSPLNV